MNDEKMIQDFAAMLKGGEHREAGAKYNADDIVSKEAMDGPMAVVTGKANVEKKGEWWYSNHEIHSATAEGPFINGEQFAMLFAVDVTFKETGQRHKIREVGLYTVKDGKIGEEKFFPMPD